MKPLTLEQLSDRAALRLSDNPVAETQKRLLCMRAIAISEERRPIDERYHRLTALVEIADDFGLQSVELLKLRSRVLDEMCEAEK